MVANTNSDLCLKVKKLIKPAVENAGLEVFDVTFRRESRGRILRVTIDGEKVSINDCAEISGVLSKLLDENDVIPDIKYSLEVSTPGLNRPLRNIDDFERFKGSLCSMVLKNKEEDGRKKYKGIIKEVNKPFVKIFVEAENRLFDIDVNKIKKANLEVV